MLAVYYTEIKWLHVGCALASGSVFISRGLLMLRGSRYANHRLLAKLSYCIDTLLLGSAVLLMITIRQYPLVQAWLTVKVLLVVAYIFLGVFALRRGKTRSNRAGFFAAAVVAYGLIIGIAVSHSAFGFFPQFTGPFHRVALICKATERQPPMQPGRVSYEPRPDQGQDSAHA